MDHDRHPRAQVIVPKMSLMTRVLSKGAADLCLFAIVLTVAIYAFANLFQLQLGHAMDDFSTSTLAMIAMTRALFGDFSFDEIVDNSSGSYARALPKSSQSSPSAG